MVASRPALRNRGVDLPDKQVEQISLLGPEANQRSSAFPVSQGVLGRTTTCSPGDASNLNGSGSREQSLPCRVYILHGRVVPACNGLLVDLRVLKGCGQRVMPHQLLELQDVHLGVDEPGSKGVT